MIFLALVLVPLAAGLGTWSLGDRRATTLAAPAMTGVIAALLAAIVAASDQPTASVRWGAGLSLELEVDPIARGPIVLVPFVALAVVLYAVTYGEDRGRSRLLGLLVVFVAAMELLLVAGDLLTLIVAWELVGLVSWALIAHHWRGHAPSDAAHAFNVTRAGDLGLFLAAGAAFAASGSLSFDRLGALASVGGLTADVFVAGIVVAAFTKSAQVPFSPWLFSAMSGPTPASALLHSATMVAAGAYLLARLQPDLDVVGWFAPVTIAVGLTTALAGGIVAALQPDAKKLLAASTSAHYGFMIVAVGAGYPTVAIAHLIAHGLFKALLFISAGVAIDAAGSNRLADMRSVQHQGSRVVAVLVAVGALALAGVPPFGGAWTKDEVVAAASHEAVWLGVLVVVAGAFSAFYATRYQLLTFGPPNTTTRSGRSGRAESGAPDRRPGRAAVGAMIVLAIGTLLLSAVWLPWGEERLLAVTGGDIAPSKWWELVLSFAAVAIGLGAGLLLRARHRLLEPVQRRHVARSIADWFGVPALTKAGIVDPVLRLADLAARFDRRMVAAGTRGVLVLGSGTSRAAARGDDDVLDAGVHGAAAFVNATSRMLARTDDRGVDAGVRAVATFTRWSARILDRVAEFGVDGAVDGIARITGSAGRLSRRTQTGLAHHYYAVIAAAAVVLVATLAVWR